MRLQSPSQQGTSVARFSPSREKDNGEREREEKGEDIESWARVIQSVSTRHPVRLFSSFPTQHLINQRDRWRGGYHRRQRRSPFASLMRLLPSPSSFYFSSSCNAIDCRPRRAPLFFLSAAAPAGRRITRATAAAPLHSYVYQLDAPRVGRPVRRYFSFFLSLQHSFDTAERCARKKKRDGTHNRILSCQSSCCGRPFVI